MDFETLGTIKLFAGNFAPRNWMICDGSTLLIEKNTALFSLLGTNYGGDGQKTFCIPDLRGRTVIGAGIGQNPKWPALDTYIGDTVGSDTVALSLQEMPAHRHQGTAFAVDADATTDNPSGKMLARPSATVSTGDEAESMIYKAPAGNNLKRLAVGSVSVLAAGAGQPHENMQPFLGMNYIICVTGRYPSRT